MTFLNPVYLYYPNLIGYLRIILTVIAFIYIDSHSGDYESIIIAISCYSLGQALDAVDGMIARYFHQSTRFGAVLDMLTDRMSTLVLLIHLSHLYPTLWLLFAALVVIDIVSHWCQMYCKLATQQTTHKASKNPFLNFYYTYPYALLVFCVGNEACFITLYLSYHSILSSLVVPILYASFPICVMKQFMNLIQLYDACNEICELDVPTSSSSSSSSSAATVDKNRFYKQNKT